MKSSKVLKALSYLVVLLFIIYCAIYFTRYAQVKHMVSKKQTSYNQCMLGANPGGIFLPSKPKTILLMAPCKTAGNITHGALWLPKYQAGTYQKIKEVL
jgi:hypothetical protein